MTVLQAILVWSAKRPAWQRDALRRLLRNGTVTQDDIDELAAIAAQSHGLQLHDDPPPEAVPWAPADLPQDESGSAVVRLLAIRETVNVNALMPGQLLRFGDSGMTVIYGDNGAGKSGYARILRRACRARSHGNAILPNVFGTPSSGAAEAKIDYAHGATTATLDWNDAASAPATLSSVSFFDSECASIHVGKANDLAYTPFGLDLLPKLVEVCQAVRTALAKAKNDTESAKPKPLAEPVAAVGTRVRTALEAITPSSDMQTFINLATLDGTDKMRMEALAGLLRDDPLAAAGELDLKVERVRRLEATLSSVEAALAGPRIDELRAAMNEVDVAKTAARVAAEEAFSGQPLAHVGSEIWARLWEAARRYSEVEAYPSSAFPLLDSEARCVLCQEPLPDSARNRLRGFGAFVRGDLQGSVAKAEETLAAIWRGLRGADIKRSEYRDSLDDLELLDEALATDVRLCLASVLRRYRCLSQGHARAVWRNPPESRVAPLARLSELHGALVQKAATLRASASAPDRRVLFDEYRELQARKWLSGVLDDVEREIDRRRRLLALSEALDETQTNAITSLSSKLTDEYVTEAVCKRFRAEVRALGGEYLRIALASGGGKYGQKLLRVEFASAGTGAAVPAILSEGESTCIALAGFFAELATEATGSGLVFDDPVSSLDHRWRRLVAERLVAEAEARQVIIFTHDLVFLLDLAEQCKAAALPLTLSHLQRTADGAGLCLDGLPWGGMTTRERLGVLKTKTQSARSAHEKQGQLAYEPLAHETYALLREAWERAVEEVLLGGAVMRFQRGIQTQKLRKLDDITGADLDAVQAGMTKASRFILGHDAAVAVNEPLPAPAELEQDVRDLESLVDAIRKRRREQ